MLYLRALRPIAAYMLNGCARFLQLECPVGTDPVILGCDFNYGKLHARFIDGSNGGFVGTSSFYYRSNLYNKEPGFFFLGEGVRKALVEVFEWLKGASCRSGTPEWLEMRRKVMEAIVRSRARTQAPGYLQDRSRAGAGIFDVALMSLQII